MISPLAIIQARLNSQRFPRKVLESIAGISLIAGAWLKAAEAFGTENVVIACPAVDAEEMSRAVSLGQIFGWPGPENDVLGRLHACASQYRRLPRSYVFRITPDDWPPILGRDGCTLRRLTEWHNTVTDPDLREHVGHLFRPVSLEINTPADLEEARAYVQLD